jgi:hypothetical protein
MRRRSAVIAALLSATLAALFACTATASAKGPPDANRYLEAKGVVNPSALPGGGPSGGRTEILSKSGDARYVTLPADASSVLLRIDTADGKVTASRLVRDGFTIPTVAIDRSASGLSADGRRLALVQPLRTFPQAETKLDVLNTTSLRSLEKISLRGSFSFDAISPDGGLLYLIQYTSPVDPTRYLVRAYDVAGSRLLHQPVVDPTEAGRPMTGRPITRAMSPDGRWAYTLYDGSDEGPFIHALDTARHRAVCVDLDSIALPRSLSGFRLSASGDANELTILDRRDEPLAAMDTQTFEISKATAQTTGASGGGGMPWLLIASVATLATGASALWLAQRRRRHGLAAGDAS